MEFKLEGEEFILLQSLLKAIGWCETGGDAKSVILEGYVTVDGIIETRRGKKMRSGQVVTFNNQQIKIIP